MVGALTRKKNQNTSLRTNQDSDFVTNINTKISQAKIYHALVFFNILISYSLEDHPRFWCYP